MPVQELTEASRTAQRTREGQPKTSLPSPLPDAKRDTWKEKKYRPAQSGATRFFGWLSVGLGTMEVLMPRAFAAIIGTPRRPILTRLMGLREIGAGIGLLTSREPAGFMNARVAGDALDIMMLKRSWNSEESGKVRLALSMAAGAAITAADIAYARKLSREQEPTGPLAIESSMAVNKTPEECYSFWRQFTNLQRFMHSVESVQPMGERTQRWKIRIPGERMFEWESETVRDSPGEAISWQSLPGGDVENSGSVSFEKRPTGMGSIVRLSMQFAPPLGTATVVPNALIKMFTEHRMREDLRRFKAVIETGEAPTTEGQPSGRSSTCEIRTSQGGRR